MRLNTSQRIILVSLTFFVLIAVIIVFIITPTILKMRDVNQQLYDLNLNLERRYQKALGLRASLSERDRIKEGVATFGQHIFYEGDELKLITSLEETATKKQVNQKILSSNFDTTKTEGVSLSIEITGRYLNVLNYLAALEKLPQFIVVRKIKMSAASGKGEVTNLDNVKLNLNLYAALSQ